MLHATALPAPTATSANFPAADLLPVQRRATPGFRLAKRLLSPLLRSLFRFEVSGLENLPAGPCVLIANHVNWIDSFSILLNLPTEPRIHFIGDPTDLLHKRFQWWFIRHVGGYVPVDRQHHRGPELSAHVEHCLERGGVLALYPEGRYGDVEGGLVRFKKGFAHFAVHAQVQVVPVGMVGHRRLWLRKRLWLTVGAPLTPGQDVDTLVTAGERAVAALVRTDPEIGGRHHLLERRLTHLF